MDTVFRRVCCLFMLSILLTTKHTWAKYRGIRLSGSKSLNKGLLEISKDGVWGNVCGNTWNMTNKDVACRHLGYPKASAVTIEGGRFGSGDKQIWIGAVQCFGDENNLWDCDYEERPSCGHSQDVGLVCQVPGYLGCYGNDQFPDWVLNGRHIRSTALTVEYCLAFCKEEGFELAGLGNKADCYCGNETNTYDRLGQFEEALCGLACTGSQDETCGGISKLSIYNVTASFCEDPKRPVGGWRKGDSTYFGQSVTFGCNNGVDLVGNDVIQCVLGGTPHAVEWSAQTPYCFGVTTPPLTIQISNGRKETSLLQENAVMVWSIAGVAGFLVIITILTVTLSIRSIARRNHRDPADTSVDFDLEPAGPSGTYRHSLHSLHLLGNIQDNLENDQHEQEKNPNLYLREEVKDSVGMQTNALAVLSLKDSEDELEWDEDMELDSDLEIDHRTSSIQHVGRTAL